jgi:hypothetical protein
MDNLPRFEPEARLHDKVRRGKGKMIGRRTCKKPVLHYFGTDVTGFP